MSYHYILLYKVSSALHQLFQMLLVEKSITYHKKKKERTIEDIQKIYSLSLDLKTEALFMLENICTNNFDFQGHF